MGYDFLRIAEKIYQEETKAQAFTVIDTDGIDASIYIETYSKNFLEWLATKAFLVKV